MYYKEIFGIRPSTKEGFTETYDTEEGAVQAALRKSCIVRGSVWFVCVEEEVIFICFNHQLFRPSTVGELIRQCKSYRTC